MSVALRLPQGAARGGDVPSSGVTSSNQAAATKFWTWIGNNNPATYSRISRAAKGAVRYPEHPATPSPICSMRPRMVRRKRMPCFNRSVLGRSELSFSLVADRTSANFIFYRGTDGSLSKSGISNDHDRRSGSIR